MNKIFEDLGGNELINESNWEELFEKYRQDGNELDPSSRDKIYNSILKKLCSREIYIIKLQQTAINIGKHQKLLNETSNEAHREHINIYQNQFNNIISSTYMALTGKQLTEESSRYTSPWLSENDTASKIDIPANEHKLTTDSIQHFRDESLTNYYANEWETTEAINISNQNT